MEKYQLLLTILGALLAAFALLALIFWLAVRRTNYTCGQAFLYIVNRFFNVCFWRTKFNQRLPIAPGQGAMLVSNHISGVDPLLIQLTTDRVVHWLVATEYFHAPVMKQVFTTLQAIPVNRGGIDTAATKAAIRYVEAGGLVGLFPEGRINTTEELLLPGRPGVALIALKARVPVIPIYVKGAPYSAKWVLGSFMMRARAQVTIGDLIDISEYYGREKEEGVLAELTMRLMTEIAKLAGVPNFEPKLAGRRWKTGEEEPTAEA